MNVYRISTFAKPSDGKFRNFASLDCKECDDKFLAFDNFRGRPFPKKWRRIELHFSEPLWPRADFYTFGRGKFVCNERAKKAAWPVMKDAGEFLPVSIEGEKEAHFIFNVTRCGPYIDPTKSIWECGADETADLDMRILAAPAFNPDSFGKETVFKIPESSGAMYCLERNRDSKEFKALIEDHGLTGLKFELAWSKQCGPLPLESPPAIKELVWITGDGKKYKAAKRK